MARNGLPGRLSAVGVTPEQFPVIAKNTMHDPWLYTNPRKISVTGLTSGTTYAFQIKALGVLGFGDWSNVATRMSL